MSCWKMVKNIIVANLYYRPFKKNEYLYITRKKICDECPHKKYSMLLGDEYCDLCGCPLKSKLRCKDEKCEINKW